MSSRDYWKRRSLNLEQLLNTRAEKTVAQISGLYDKAQEHVVGQIERVFSTYAKKGGALNEQKASELLTVKETEEARAALREQYQTATGQVKRDIWARLSAPAYANRISRLQALRDDIYAQARRVGLSEVEYVHDRLEDTLEQSYYRTIFDVEQYTGEGYRFDLLGDNQVTAALAANWSGKNWSDRLWDNNQRFADAVEETVTVGILAGLRYDEMRDNLLHVIGLDDTEGAKYNARRLVMTECNYVANQGHLMGYKAAGIEYYIYLATLDLRTSEICRRLDGQRFPVDEATPGTNLPPMHPHCRSTTMCDMSREQLNRVNRAARDPVTGKSVTIPGYMTYREWYEKYVEGNPQAEANEKKTRNQASDQRQFANYRQVLGDEAPKTFAEFQQMKYTDSEAWEDLKTFRQYRNQEPDGSLADALANRELREQQLIRGHVVPKKTRRAYILEDKASKRDPAHIMKRMAERLITDDEVQSYVDDVVVCVSQFRGTREVYYSDDGVTVLTRTSDYDGAEWIAKTAWKKEDFDDSTLKILEVARSYYDKQT